MSAILSEVEGSLFSLHHGFDKLTMTSSMPKTTTTEARFYACSKLSGSFPGNSPVFFTLQSPIAAYQEHKTLVDEIISEIEAGSLYSSLELLVEKLNKLISKKAVKSFLSIAVFQKEGSTIKVAAFPKCVVSFQPIMRDGSRGAGRDLPLQYADTNRVFSEILEIDSALSARLAFSFETSDGAANASLVVEKNSISPSLPAKPFPIPSFIRSYVSRQKAKQKATQKQPAWKGSLKYAVALLIAVFAIVGINNAKSNKFIEKKESSNAPWTRVAEAEVQPIVDLKEKLPSKYIHEPGGLVQTSNFIYTFQNDPNIILQIDSKGDVKPIVIDSEKVGKLTGIKKISDDLILLTHDRKGIIFLAPSEQRWRLVEFSKPTISEYTDIEVYNDYIYVLDARSRQIWKLQLTENELTGTSWVRDSRVDLSLASSMAIDGSIYLTLITGDVVKLTQGKKDAEFAISPELSPALSSADSVEFDQETKQVVVLDRVNNRIVFLESNGNFVNQIKNPFPLPFDAITAEQGRVFGVIQSDVVGMKIKQ